MSRVDLKSYESKDLNLKTVKYYPPFSRHPYKKKLKLTWGMNLSHLVLPISFSKR